MKYDFNTIESFTATRAALKEFRKSLSLLHHSLVCQTKIRHINTKFRELRNFILDYKSSDSYELLCEYISTVRCPNFFNRLDDELLENLNQRSYSLQEVLSILKKISLIIDEVDQEIFNINERYFL